MASGRSDECETEPCCVVCKYGQIMGMFVAQTIFFFENCQYSQFLLIFRQLVATMEKVTYQRYGIPFLSYSQNNFHVKYLCKFQVEVYDPKTDTWTFVAAMCAHGGGVGVGVIPIS